VSPSSASVCGPARPGCASSDCASPGDNLCKLAYSINKATTSADSCRSMRDLIAREFSSFPAAPLMRWASLCRWSLFMSTTHPNTASGAEFAHDSGVRPVSVVRRGVLFMKKPTHSRDSLTECAPKARDRETHMVLENNLYRACLFQLKQLLERKSGDCPFH
jgi:hypothetical protein